MRDHTQRGGRGRRYHHPRGHRPPFADGTDGLAGPGFGRRRGGRGRRPRGDVRAAVLLLVAEQPMHGYQIMQAIADRTGGSWAPSPGAVYPAINLLEDEGLVSVTAESGRRLVTLTDAGRKHVAEQSAQGDDPFAGFEAAAPGSDLRRLMHELHDAARQVGRAGSDAQREAAATILTDARRSLYLLLADGPQDPAG